MSKFWRVALYEYKRHVLQKRFIFALLSVPLFIGMIILMVVFLVYIETDVTPVGYVDASGLLANPVPGPSRKSLTARCLYWLLPAMLRRKLP